jgi:hypothetical protein
MRRRGDGWAGRLLKGRGVGGGGGEGHSQVGYRIPIPQVAHTRSDQPVEPLCDLFGQPTMGPSYRPSSGTQPYFMRHEAALRSRCNVQRCAAFQSATAFNQSVGAWNVARLANMVNTSDGGAPTAAEAADHVVERYTRRLRSARESPRAAAAALALRRRRPRAGRQRCDAKADMARREDEGRRGKARRGMWRAVEGYGGGGHSVSKLRPNGTCRPRPIFQPRSLPDRIDRCNTRLCLGR